MDTNSVHLHITKVAFDPLKVIDTHRLQEEWQEGWISQTLCQVNDHRELLVVEKR